MTRKWSQLAQCNCTCAHTHPDLVLPSKMFMPWWWELIAPLASSLPTAPRGSWTSSPTQGIHQVTEDVVSSSWQQTPGEVYDPLLLNRDYRNLEVIYVHPCDTLSLLTTTSEHSLRWARDSVDIVSLMCILILMGQSLWTAEFLPSQNVWILPMSHKPTYLNLSIFAFKILSTGIGLSWSLPHQSIIYQENVPQVNLVGAFFSIEFFSSQMTLACVNLT